MTRAVVSGFGRDGGLFVLDGAEWRRIDRLPTVGLAVSPDGTRMVRALFGAHPDAETHLLMYDAAGLRWYRRMPEIADPHGMMWVDDERFAVASTLTNTIVWLGAEDGRHLGDRQLASAPDAWHVNTPAFDHGGALVTSAFGTFDAAYGWREARRARAATGVIVDVESGDVRVGGLVLPHDPLPRNGGGWIVNNSGLRELAELDPGGQIVRRVDVGGWSRGLLEEEDGHLLVGTSARRHTDPDGCATVVRIDPAHFTVSERWTLECEEVFSIVAVSEPLLAGLRLGCAAIPGGVSLEAPELGLETVMDAAVDPYDFAIAVTVAEAPTQVSPGEDFTLLLTAENRGDAILTSVGPVPVALGGRWVAEGGATWGNEPRASFRAPLLPGRRARVSVHVKAPKEPGMWHLHLGAVQESVAWANDLDPSLGCVLPIVVAAG